MAGRVFITGGTGFVGKAILRGLVADGRSVSALVRSESSARTLKELGADPVWGDILEPDRVLEGMQGSEVVYHAAGVNAFCLRDPSPMFRVNVEGSRAVIEAAATAGIG